MDAKNYSYYILKKAHKITRHFTSYFGIGVLALIISLALTAKANAIYMMSDFDHAGTYIDKGRYYFLDYGQYYYLDKGQYHLSGKLDYYWGHSFYTRLYEKSINQEIRFSNTLNEAWFIFLAEKFPVSNFNQQRSSCFNVGQAIYRRHYDLLDKLKYNYLDKGQYQLLGTLGYSSSHLYYQKQFTGIAHPLKVAVNPEPSTIAFLALGSVGIIVFRRKSRNKRTA
jgi:hypothetical protein